MKEQVKITIIADKGYVADALRVAANEIEFRDEDMYDFEVENYHHVITVEEI